MANSYAKSFNVLDGDGRKIRTTLYIKRSTYKKLKIKCAKEDTKVSAVMNELIEKYLKAGK